MTLHTAWLYHLFRLTRLRDCSKSTPVYRLKSKISQNIVV